MDKGGHRYLADVTATNKDRISIYRTKGSAKTNLYTYSRDTGVDKDTLTAVKVEVTIKVL